MVLVLDRRRLAEFLCSSRLLCVMVREYGMFMESGIGNICGWFDEYTLSRLLIKISVGSIFFVLICCSRFREDLLPRRCKAIFVSFVVRNCCISDELLIA